MDEELDKEVHGLGERCARNEAGKSATPDLRFCKMGPGSLPEIPPELPPEISPVVRPTPPSLGLPPLKPPLGCLEQLQVVTHAHVHGQVAVVGPHVALGYLRGEAAPNLRLSPADETPDQKQASPMEVLGGGRRSYAAAAEQVKGGILRAE